MLSLCHLSLSTSHIALPIFSFLIISLALVTSVSTALFLLNQRQARQDAAALQGPTARMAPTIWFPALQAPSAP